LNAKNSACHLLVGKRPFIPSFFHFIASLLFSRALPVTNYTIIKSRAWLFHFFSLRLSILFHMKDISMKLFANIFFGVACWPSIVLFFLLQQKFGVVQASFSALVYALFYTIIAMGFDRQTRLDLGVVLFWVTGLIVTFFNGELLPGYFSGRFSTFLYLSLFLCAYLPMVAGAQPFTIQFAKRNTPEEFQQTDYFFKTNRIMSLGWAGLFLFIICITLTGGFYAQIVIPLLLVLIIGIPFNLKFPKFYLQTKGIDLTAMSSSLQKATNHEISTGPENIGQPEKSIESINRQRRKIADKLGPVKKALIIFGSPRKEKGHTYRLLSRFINGMKESGVDVELIHLLDYNIRPCTGCFSCWTRTPGRCIHKDDMGDLLKKFDQADFVVYAQPLYVFTVPGIMKNFLDRCLPRLEPYLIRKENGSTRHPRRWTQNGRVVIFSVCGFPEMEHFDALRRMYRLLSETSGTHIVGEVLRPASESLQFSNQMGGAVEAIEDAIVEAGRQIGTIGYIKRETEKTISQSLFKDRNNFHKVANEFWDTWIRFESARRRGETNETLQDYLDNEPGILFKGMAAVFDKEKAGDFKATFQFNLQDGNRDQYYITIDNGKCVTWEGKTKDADVIINTPFTIWKSISRGEISGREALSRGLYSVEGNIGHLLKFNEIFGRNE